NHCSNWGITACKSLRGGKDVRLQAIMVARKESIDSTETANDLISDDEYVVPICDFADASQVTGRRHQTASRILNRFDDDCCDGVCTFTEDRRLDLVGSPDSELDGI